MLQICIPSTLVWQSLMPNKAEASPRTRRHECETLLMLIKTCCTSFVVNGGKLGETTIDPESPRKVPGKSLSDLTVTP